ncbi:hypothetical protein KNO15_06800 [Leifsonia shinshuensis]|uniref:hypothetical protein n=1 Tax=Leifsonia shinshuensis TaxID=150026 RepID=UPI001F51035A|nr:hypothetical protein [Leifsonia shinshuensis]MCI0156402.1 hypothetical protein [Leifsonia shinshuensis]
MRSNVMNGKAIVMAGVLATVLGLAGCASPDPAPVQSAIATAPGILDARVVIGHSGAPWNVDPIITLYLADASADAIEAAVRSTAKAISGDDVAKHPVSVFVVMGEPDASSDGDGMPIPEGVGTQLGIGEEATRFSMIRLTPDDIRRLAADR